MSSNLQGLAASFHQKPQDSRSAAPAPSWRETVRHLVWGPLKPAVDELAKYEDQRLTVLALIEMRRAGHFSAIYCDEGKLRIKVTREEPPRRITWVEAANLVRAWREEENQRKPPARATKSEQPRGRRSQSSAKSTGQKLTNRKGGAM